MNKAEVLQRILEVGIVPVIRAGSSEDALSATEAVYRGGIPIAEITMTVPGAVAAIRSLVQQRGRDILIGAGTVLDVQAARQCVEAGAQFLASPGLDLETVAFAHSQNKVMFAGALTPSEIIAAWRAGSDLVKVFPCNALGGPKYIASLKGPLPQVQLVPSGGVSLETISEFIRAGASAVAVGGELVDAKAVRSRRMETISQNARSFVELIHKARKSN
jgi:2-dehydro-3-deoxyphosphogluconate aldolase/(4S)-4-hydroxy-2-oxoglutarate aldolase